MNTPAISVENLGKMYHIGLFQRRPQNLREALKRTATAPFSYLATHLRHLRAGRGSEATDSPDVLWALKDVTFEVARGEVLGIIGRNGAGKSTLLKILSRITDPTEGRARIRGRVNSLLEVGAGFHPELTGRENVYMNAAMHGMKRADIRRKMDEIVAFAEVDKFMDTPVKRYSSGMYTRLAFAVAANLEPEVLIVDEVLAVGDAGFQRRCLGKMGDVAEEGRTVLLVSHNMQAISTLCRRVVLLDRGRVLMQGTARAVVEKYLETRAGRAEIAWDDGQGPGNESVRLRSVSVRTPEGAAVSDHDMAAPIRLDMEFAVSRPGLHLNASFHVYNQQDVCLFAVANHHDAEWGSRRFSPGIYRCCCVIPGHFLNEGGHRVGAFVVQDKTKTLAAAPNAVSFCVHDYGMGRGGYTGAWIGVVRPLLPWTHEQVGGVQ